MRVRVPVAAIGALGLAVLAIAGVAVLTSINRAVVIRKTRLSVTVTVNSLVTFAPPPPDAMPALSPQQALRQSDEHRRSRHALSPAYRTVKLGILSLLLGPYCAADCHSSLVRNGFAYQILDRLAYGYSRPSICVSRNRIHQLRPARCVRWEFIDADTGQVIIATQQYRPKWPREPISEG
jgi:hypothetical protein